MLKNLLDKDHKVTIEFDNNGVVLKKNFSEIILNQDAKVIGLYRSKGNWDMYTYTLQTNGTTSVYKIMVGLYICTDWKG